MRLLASLLGRSRHHTGRATARDKRAPLCVEPLEPRVVLNAADNTAFLMKAFQDLLHRPIEPAALTFFATQLNTNVSRVQVVLEIESSNEFHSIEAQNQYQTLLGRPADPFGLLAFTSFLNAGGTVEQVQAALPSS